MNRILLFVLGMFLLINFACQKEVKQKQQTTQQTPKKYSFVVNRNIDLIDFSDLKDEKQKKQDNFFKIVESFQAPSFSLDELIDLTDEDLKIIKSVKTKRLKGTMDTASIKSRMVLTEVYLQKLKYLIHQQNPQKDTISRTLNAIVANLNSVLNQMKIYNNSTDEFESILKHDSIAKEQMMMKDSLKMRKSPRVRKERD